MSDQTVDDALVASLARSAVSAVAPEELPLFRATSEAYFADPSASAPKRSGDEMLGFGVEAALVLVTPAALSVARAVVNAVVAEIGAKAGDGAKGVVDRLAARLLHREAPGDGADGEAAVPLLTQEQLREVRAVALANAQRLELEPDRAQLLADALVGSLATA